MRISCLLTMLLIGLETAIPSIGAHAQGAQPRAAAAAGGAFVPTYEENVSRPGQDYHHFPAAAPDAMLCRRSCEADAQCHAWGYDPPEKTRDHVPVCWLKSKVPNAVAAQGYISGVTRPDDAGATPAVIAAAPASPPPPVAAPPAAPLPKPNCHIDDFIFSAVNSDSVSVNGVSTAGAPCSHKVAPQRPDLVQFTSASIEKQPSNGSFAQLGAFEFRYQLNAGFKGADQYAIKVCGHNNQRGGCAIITYKLTVN
jgi:hypothetical protein